MNKILVGELLGMAAKEPAALTPGDTSNALFCPWTLGGYRSTLQPGFCTDADETAWEPGIKSQMSRTGPR